jgi:hypothetical protein
LPRQLESRRIFSWLLHQHLERLNAALDVKQRVADLDKVPAVGRPNEREAVNTHARPVTHDDVRGGAFSSVSHREGLFAVVSEAVAGREGRDLILDGVRGGGSEFLLDFGVCHLVSTNSGK